MNKLLEIAGLTLTLHILFVIITRQSLWNIFSFISFVPIIYQRTLDPLDYPQQNHLHLLYYSINTYTFTSITSHMFSLFVQTGIPTLDYPMGPFNAAIINQKSFYEFVSILIGLGYCLYRIFTDKDKLRYAPIQGRKWFRIKSLVYSSIRNGIIISGYSIIGFAFGYTFIGSVFFYPFMNLLKLFGYKIAKQSFSFFTIFSITLQFQIFMRLVRVIACWEFLHLLYNLYMTMVPTINQPEPFDLNSLSAEPVKKYSQFFGLYHQIKTSSSFRQSIFDDVSQEPMLKKIEFLCLAELKSLTKKIQEHSQDDKQFKKENIESIQNDDRNAYQYQKKKQLQVRGGLATTQTGSILAHRKKNAVDTALSYLVEEEKPKIPLQDPMMEKPVKIPTVLLPKQEPESITLSMKLNTETKIPGSIDFLKALSGLLERIPFGSFVLQDTILRESQLVFRDMQLSIWSCSILGTLTLSTKQDKYAQLSQMVPHVLQVLLALHTAIETWIKKKQASSKPLELKLLHPETCPPILKPFVTESNHIISLPYTMLQVVEQCVYQILGTFYTSMDRYQFDVEYVEKLQKFMDFAQ